MEFRASARSEHSGGVWMKRLLIALVGAAFLAGSVLLAGCATDTESEEVDTSDSATGITPDSGTLEGEVIPVAFTDEAGQIVCPVMGTLIESAEKAMDHEDFNDKRYYFCCGECPEKFRADPEMYKDGKPDGEAGEMGDHMDDEGMGGG